MATARRFVRNSETSLWRECRLKWYLSYYLGFLTDTINPNFWLGTLIHQALSEWYLDRVQHPAHYFWWLAEESITQERGFSISIDGSDFEMDYLADLEKYQKMGVAMLEGYLEWAAEHHSDFDVLDSELSYFVDLVTHHGRPFTFVGRFDMLTEDSEGLRVQDFKTAKDFRAIQTVDQDPQFRRYPWMLTEAHPEWADDVAGSQWIGLRKIIPSSRSKPPYFDTVPIDLTSAELAGAKREVVSEVTEMLVVEETLQAGTNTADVIYPSPTFDCSWKCQFFKNGMCQSWRAGLDVTEYGKLHGSWNNDPYAEYKDDFDTAVLTIGRREGGE